MIDAFGRPNNADVTRSRSFKLCACYYSLVTCSLSAYKRFINAARYYYFSADQTALRPYPHTMADQEDTKPVLKEKTGLSGWAHRKAVGYNAAKEDMSPTPDQLKGTKAPEEYQRLVVPSKLPDSEYPVRTLSIELPA